MVDHKILLQRLESSYGIKGVPLLWLQSYLSGRTQMVIAGNSRPNWVPVFLGVPQGSVLGPLLFILYTADVTSLFPSHSATGHLFADDVQAYVHGSPSTQLILVRRIQALSHDLHLWMSSNRLSLNSNKTQLIWLGTPQQIKQIDCLLLSQTFPQFTFSTSVRDLGVSLSTMTSIVHAFVCSRIDYCNSLLIGLPKVRLSPIQSVLNAAARLIARLPKYSHISSFMINQLHWHPLSARIQYKVLSLVLKSKLGLAPMYLSDLIRSPLSASSHRPLRSLDRADLFVPRARTTIAQTRSFTIIGPSLWNSLPSTLRGTLLSGLLSTSLSLLKTYFFSRVIALGALLNGLGCERRYRNY